MGVEDHGYQQPEQFQPGYQLPAAPASYSSGAPAASMDTAQLFHVVCIVCAVLTFFSTQLVMLIPMVMWFVCKDAMMNQSAEHEASHRVDWTVNLIIFLFWVVIFAMFTILTFGLGIIFAVFLIPQGIVLAQLRHSKPQMGGYQAVYV